jgi:hypothetical protein
MREREGTAATTTGKTGVKIGSVEWLIGLFNKGQLSREETAIKTAAVYLNQFNELVRAKDLAAAIVMNQGEDCEVLDINTARSWGANKNSLTQGPPAVIYASNPLVACFYNERVGLTAVNVPLLKLRHFTPYVLKRIGDNKKLNQLSQDLMNETLLEGQSGIKLITMTELVQAFRTATIRGDREFYRLGGKDYSSLGTEVWVMGAEFLSRWPTPFLSKTRATSLLRLNSPELAITPNYHFKLLGKNAGLIYDGRGLKIIDPVEKPEFV